MSKNSQLKSLIQKLESSIHLMTLHEKDEALKFINDSNKVLAVDDFYVFLRLIAPEIIPPPFIDGRHLFIYCNELERLERAVVSGDKEKLQLFLPPGSMKSVTLCLFVAWIMGRHPDWYILHIGHTADFAKEYFGQKIRDILTLPEYQEIFPETKLSRTTRRKDTWKTTDGGVYHCTGVGNQIAGKRAHISICDDVLSEQTAISKTERNKINAWYVPGLRSRLLPTGCEVIVNTRWHLNDLSGYIIDLDNKGDQKPWRIVAIPAILEGELGEKAAARLGLPIGSSFWPEYWTKEKLMEMKGTNTPQYWNAMYMQNPIPDEGNIFKKHHFNRWLEIERGMPKFSYIIISADTAFSTNTAADNSTYGVWGVFTHDQGEGEETISGVMLIHAEKGHWDYPTLKQKLIDVYQEYKARFLVVEKKASGQSIIQDLAAMGLPVVGWPLSGAKLDDKTTRAHACVPFLEAGMVWILDNGMWVDDFLTELYNFSESADKDDQVDQFTQAILWMRDNLQLKLKSYGTIKTNYGNDDDDDDKPKRPKPRPSYWRARVRRR